MTAINSAFAIEIEGPREGGLSEASPHLSVVAVGATQSAELPDHPRARITNGRGLRAAAGQ